MDKRDITERPSPATPRERASAVAESWLDCALEDTFPASDPIASNLFD
jgi:hypothetical protein